MEAIRALAPLPAVRQTRFCLPVVNKGIEEPFELDHLSDRFQEEGVEAAAGSIGSQGAKVMSQISYVELQQGIEIVTSLHEIKSWIASVRESVVRCQFIAHGHLRLARGMNMFD